MRLAAEKEVFGNGQIFEKVYFLIDGADTEGLRFADIGGRYLATFQKDGAAVAVVNAGQYLDEC